MKKENSENHKQKLENQQQVEQPNLLDLFSKTFPDTFYEAGTEERATK